MIRDFKNNQYNWLSNFYPVKIVYEGIEYPSVEHAYQSARVNSKVWKEFCSNPENSASSVKKLSKAQLIVSNWSDIKQNVMEVCLREKFSQEPFRQKLIDTGFEEIQEGNWWGDVYWGVDIKTGIGENHLGKLIMKIREELIKI